MKNLKIVILNAMTIALLFSMLIACTQMKQEISDPAPIFKYDQDAFQGPKPWTSENFANKPENFQFVIIGDRTGGANAQHTFTLAMEQINLLQPEFVINVGDLIEGYPEDKADLNGMWDEADDLLDKLDMPFFLTIGNHDVSTPETKEV